MAKYNGHRSWNSWNVSLWINNDEPLYRQAVDLCQRYGADKASRIMARDMCGQQTPDGGKYNRTCIREAMRGILD